MGIRDDQLDAAQAPARQSAQEFRPERFSLRRPHGHAENFALTVRINADSYYYGNRDDTAGLANFDIGGVDPHVGPHAFNGALQKGVDAFVNVSAQSRNLDFGDASYAHCFDKLIDRAG